MMMLTQTMVIFVLVTHQDLIMSVSHIEEILHCCLLYRSVSLPLSA